MFFSTILNGSRIGRLATGSGVDDETSTTSAAVDTADSTEERKEASDSFDRKNLMTIW